MNSKDRRMAAFLGDIFSEALGWAKVGPAGTGAEARMRALREPAQASISASWTVLQVLRKRNDKFGQHLEIPTGIKVHLYRRVFKESGSGRDPSGPFEGNCAATNCVPEIDARLFSKLVIRTRARHYR